MKYTLTLLVIVIFMGLQAQTYPWLSPLSNDIPSRDQLLDPDMARANLRSMTRIYSTYKRNGTPEKKKLINTLKFNEKGFLVYYEGTSNSNKTSRVFEYTYRDSLLSGLTFKKNNVLKMSIELKRRSDDYITDRIKKNGKGQVVLQQHYDYDPATKKINKTTVYGKNNKEQKAVEYTYYEDGKLKEAKEYKRGKLKKVWNYSCDPAGKDAKKEVKVCQNVSVDENGNRVETNRIINTKGEVELRVNTFDKDDRVIKQLVYDDIKHLLKNEYKVAFKNGNEESTYITYNKKKKQTYYQYLVHSSDHKILESDYKWGRNLKHRSRTEFEYNEKNLLVHSISYDSENRKSTENVHSFN